MHEDWFTDERPRDRKLKQVALATAAVLAVLSLVVGILLITRPGSTAPVADVSPSGSPGAGVTPQPSAVASPLASLSPTPDYSPDPALTPTSSPPAKPRPSGSAEPPGQSMSGPIPIDALPFVQRMDVDTYGEGDQVDDACGFYQSEQVWFSFTPSQTMFVGVHTQGSDFYTAVTVYRQGRNGQPRFVDCSALDPHAWVIFEARADATYLLLVQRAIDHGSGTDLVLSVVAAPPPIGVQVALDGSGIVDEAGVASMSGTVTCSTRVDDLQINFALSQSGDWDGEGSIRVACSPSTVEWVAEVHPTGFGGVLVPGPALGLAWGRACNSVDGLEFCTGFSDGEYIGGRQNILLEAKAVWTPWPEPPSPSAEPDVPPPGAATESP